MTFTASFLQSFKRGFPGIYKVLTRLLIRFKIDKLLGIGKPKSKVIKTHKTGQADDRILRKYKAHIANLKRKLLTEGFIEKAYSDLQLIASTQKNLFLQQEAAWELALWHANLNTVDDARTCLRFLSIAIDINTAEQRFQRAAIIQAECLGLLGEFGVAAEILTNALEKRQTDDLLLARSNLATSLEEKSEWFNKVFELHNISPITISNDDSLPYFDRLKPLNKSISTEIASGKGPLVTIIVPAYNCYNTIHNALDSLLAQTWRNMEIIIVDDCSTDNTVSVIEQYLEKDKRVQLIKSEINLGPYSARNMALQIAKGEFVTCHDSDDWSHPEKIELQANHLIQNPGCVANISQLTRVNDDLKCFRRGNPGHYIQFNMSSLMFRRQDVITKLGYWDSVRFGADGEMVQRLKKMFGEEKLITLETGPVYFARQPENSLTGNSKFGYPGYFMGARREYLDAFNNFLGKGESLKYEFPLKERKFSIPEPMLPVRGIKQGQKRHFDVIIASEFRLPGGTTSSNIEEIRAQKAAGLTTGLIQINRYDLNSVTSINEKVRKEIDGKVVQMIVYGEAVTCDLLIIRHPPVLEEYQRFIPDVLAEKVVVVINTSPLRDYGEGGEKVYDFLKCKNNLLKYFGKDGLWLPIGPLVREAVLREENIKDIINFSDNDWHNIVNMKEWYTEAPRCAGPKAIIGRHSRDNYVKWPDNQDDLLKIYPDDDRFVVKILGGAKTVEDMLGKFPENWIVYPFGSISPRQFLSEIDFCVYFHHKDLVEAFGRTPLEAMAAGIPVILPDHFNVLFKESAIYAKPDEVKDIVLNLYNHKSLYQQQVIIARNFVEENFGYTQHLKRIRPYVKKLN